MKSVFSDEYDIMLRSLVAVRKDAGITQQELADRLGKPQSFVSKYENRERRLDMAEFVVICRALDASPKNVLGEMLSRLDKPKRKR